MQVKSGYPRISLVLVGPDGRADQHEELIELVRAKGCSPSICPFSLPARLENPSGLESIREELVGRSLFRRLAFFADSEDVPYLIAPLLLRHLWTQVDADAFVFAYPGISIERVGDACGMIAASSCDAVLFRGDHEEAVVAGLARSQINERVMLHWGDCIQQLSMHPAGPDRLNRGIGSEIVSHVCERVCSIRAPHRAPVSSGSVSPLLAKLPTGTTITPALRNLIGKLLPELDVLVDDPFQNAVEALNAAVPEIEQDPGNLITRMVWHFWSERADLQAAFNLSTREGRRGLVDWFLSRGPVELDLSEEFLRPVRSERENLANEQTPEATGEPGSLANATSDYLQRGLNLIGYVRAEMGMGEQLRLTASALDTTSFPFGIVNFNFGIIASQREKQYEQLIRTDNPFEINLFHVNADQMPLASEKLAPKFFRNRYNIGYWEWELSKFPEEWLGAIDIVDEIWAPSRFIQGAISQATAKPVIWMPLAVEFPVPESPSRRKFGLPEDAFLFLFCFDFSSFATRKNFAGCIEAFLKAFSRSDRNVGLVIKTIRHPHHTREFWDLLRAAGNDPRIHLIDSVLRRAEIHELIASCDSFVSLHRSEGFGLGLAEAMFLAKPVIATNYSGNIDFTKDNNSCLVDYRLIPVRSGEYVFSDGQSWAEPDIDQAAMYMQRLVGNPEYSKRLGDTAARFIRHHHSCSAIGARYSERLQQISKARALLAWRPRGSEREPDRNEISLRTVMKRLIS